MGSSGSGTQEEVAHKGKEAKMEYREMRASRASKEVKWTVHGGGLAWA